MINDGLPADEPESRNGNHALAKGQDLSDQDLLELRELLFGQEQEEIETLQERIENPDLHAVDVARALPEAVRQSIEDSEQLSRALAPTIDETLQISVKKNPQRMVDALSPVMMPAIRKSIGDTFKTMVQSLNEALERSLSVQGMKWRLEAMRTGRPFAEVVLLRSLQYRVEQAFLIHRETGLLLHHATRGGFGVSNPDLVSGMLTAIKDFVQDSFGAPGEETLNTLEVGQFTVWVEVGPEAVLAAVIRGTAPLGLRDDLRDALNKIHTDWAEPLDSFTGDNEPFVATDPLLAGCLREAKVESKNQGETTARRKIRISPPFMVVLALVALLIGTWWWVSASHAERVESYFAQLSNEPGVVVIATSYEGGKHFARGLLDPHARPPKDLLPAFGLDPEDFDGEWRPYASMDDEMIVARARATLRPPPALELAWENGQLAARGVASHEWIKRARVLAQALPGVPSLDESELIDLDLEELREKVAGLNRLRLTALPTPDTPARADPRFTGLAAELEDLSRQAWSLGQELLVDLMGWSNRKPDPAITQRWTREMQTLLRQRGQLVPVLTLKGRVPRGGVAASLDESLGPEPQISLQVRLKP